MTLALRRNTSYKSMLSVKASRWMNMPCAVCFRRRLHNQPVSHIALQFSGIALSGRTAEEIDAEIKAMRDEWEEREHALRPASSTPDATP